MNKGVCVPLWSPRNWGIHKPTTHSFHSLSQLSRNLQTNGGVVHHNAILRKVLCQAFNNTTFTAKHGTSSLFIRKAGCDDVRPLCHFRRRGCNMYRLRSEVIGLRSHLFLKPPRLVNAAGGDNETESCASEGTRHSDSHVSKPDNADHRCFTRRCTRAVRSQTRHQATVHGVLDRSDGDMDP